MWSFPSRRLAKTGYAGRVSPAAATSAELLQTREPADAFEFCERHRSEGIVLCPHVEPPDASHHPTGRLPLQTSPRVPPSATRRARLLQDATQRASRRVRSRNASRWQARCGRLASRFPSARPGAHRAPFATALEDSSPGSPARHRRAARDCRADTGGGSRSSTATMTEAGLWPSKAPDLWPSRSAPRRARRYRCGHSHHAFRPASATCSRRYPAASPVP
jgi:hypothetical protein